MKESLGDQSLVASRKAAPKLSGLKLLMAAAVIVVTVGGAVRFGAGDLVTPVRDEVPTAEVARRAAVLNGLTPLKLDEVPAADRNAAIAAMALPPQEQRTLTAELSESRARLVWMSFYDSDAEDGDVITVSSGGLIQTVRLTKQPIRLALPTPADGLVRVVGTVDGAGGGVTVGIVTSAGPTPLAVLSVGQTITVPVKSE